MDSESSKFLIPALIILGVALIVFLGYYYSKKQVILRKLSQFKLKRITQIRTNELTKIIGKVLSVEEPFIAPFSKRECVAYIFEVKQKVSTGKSSHWKTLVKQENIQDFFVEQNGEVVIIKPSIASSNYISYLVEDKKITSGTFNDPTPEFNKVLKYYNIDSTNWFGFNKTLKYTERIIEIGETITIAGIAKWKTANDAVEGYRYSKIAALESSDKQKIIITDLPEARKEEERKL